jgi:hypothetical protein
MVIQYISAVSVTSDDFWQSLEENTPMTFGVGAKELSHLQPEPDGNAFPWQISGGALRAVVNFTCDRLAGWTNDNRLRAADEKANGAGHLNDLLWLENLSASQ